MRFFRNDTYLRRATGAAIVLGLLTLWARHWRDDIAAQASYSTQGYNSANNIGPVLLALTIAATVYVAACLVLTPSER